jgi:NAD(P)-dependent dehydrogenase (short-subunit alcohol dehydrogenase family)
MDSPLAGRTAIVTGASSGIGAAIARSLADVGAAVVGCAPADDRDDLETVVASIDEAGGSALAVDCDVTDRDAVAGLVDATVERFGDIDLLVNNAGIWDPAPLSELDAATWRRIVSVVLDGTFNCTQLAGPHLRDGGGAVVNIASGAGLAGFPNNAPYGAAKAGVINFTETIAFEWAHDDVRVNAVAPGLVATETARRGSSLPVPEPSAIDRTRVARRVGTPEEIADVVRFLCTPAASFITGAVVPVSGVPRLERAFEVRRPEHGGWID